MLKKIFIFIVLLILQFILWNNIFAEQIPVEKVFTDINKNYKYYNELQTLYDKWMIFPDENWKLNPKKLLNRDEFVGIFMEVSCKKCISPNTSFNIIKRNFWVETFYDVNKNNKYFYCITESDKLWYVKWYWKGYQCEWKFSIEWKRPFCIDNKPMIRFKNVLLPSPLEPSIKTLSLSEHVKLSIFIRGLSKES